MIYFAKDRNSTISFSPRKTKALTRLCVFRRRRRSRGPNRIGGANTRTSSTRSATRETRRHDWRRVKMWTICRHRRPAIPAITSSASTAAESSMRPPRSGTSRFANVCRTRSNRKRRGGDAREEVAATSGPLPSLSAKKEDRSCTSPIN